MDWPVGKKKCNHKGCKDTDTTPCFYSVYRHDISPLAALFRYGPRCAWQIWREGDSIVLDGYYCAQHAYEEGFCWMCGNYYVGASERFDFKIDDQWLCDGCWDQFKSEFDEDYEDEDYLGP